MIGRLPYAVDLDEVEPRREEEVVARARAAGSRPSRPATRSPRWATPLRRGRAARAPSTSPRPARSACPRARLGGASSAASEVHAPDGRTVRPDQVLGAPRPRPPDRGDRRHRARADTLERRGRRASVLVHEATFLDEDRDRAPRDAAQHGPRGGGAGPRGRRRACWRSPTSPAGCSPREVRREAEREFPRVLVPRDFDQIEVPVPGAGRAGDSRAARRGPAAAPLTCRQRRLLRSHALDL